VDPEQPSTPERPNVIPPMPLPPKS
jgi:hypothetical protein